MSLGSFSNTCRLELTSFGQLLKITSKVDYGKLQEELQEFYDEDKENGFQNKKETERGRIRFGE